MNEWRLTITLYGRPKERFFHEAPAALQRILAIIETGHLPSDSFGTGGSEHNYFGCFVKLECPVLDKIAELRRQADLLESELQKITLDATG